MSAVDFFGISGKIESYVRVESRLRHINRILTLECEEVMKIFGNKVLYPVHLRTYGGGRSLGGHLRRRVQ